MSNRRIFLSILFCLSLYILTEASVPLDKKVRTSYTSPESSLKQHYGIGSKNSSLTNHLISLKSSTRSFSITVRGTYYLFSTSCSGNNNISFSFDSSTSGIYEKINVYEFFYIYLNYELPSVTKAVTSYLSGYGSNMSLNVCYNGDCHQYPLSHCIDMSRIMVDIGASEGNAEYGSLSLDITRPSSPSSPSPSPASTSFSSSGVHCLSEDSKVYSSSFQELNIGSIRSNDFILTLDAKSKAIRSTRVIGWLDKKDDVRVTFLGIKHEMGYLKVSPYHLLMRFGANKVDAVFAKDIRIGDNLLFQNNSVASYSQVTEIRNVVQMGAFAPLTMDGNFLANGVLVSCYAHFASHRLAHLAFAPYRWYYSTIGHFTASEPQNHIRLLKTLLHWSNRIHLSSGIIGAKA
ncbi:hypothetical protein GpartN1_g1803.t1 [Galdieria partita]|uniref:Hedgehog protein n=1 Tax=Galdieria partita TaxID=83374 RepID=A0A9C7UP08_9RHOD|nr:hypothetical protein GpartN1_g1803.t1 [Galdieria partita]